MNAYYDAAEFLALKEVSIPSAQRRIAIVAVSFALALLLGFVSVMPALAHHDAPEAISLSTYVAANPELSAVHRFLLVYADRAASASIARWHGLADYYRQMAVDDAIARLDALAEIDSAMLWEDLLVYDANGRYRYGD